MIKDAQGSWRLETSGKGQLAAIPHLLIAVMISSLSRTRLWTVPNPRNRYSGRRHRQQISHRRLVLLACL